MKFIAITIFITACAQLTVDDQLNSIKKTYTKNAISLLKLNEKEAGSQQIKEMSQGLVDLGVNFLSLYAKKHKECKSLISTIIARKSVMTKLNLDEIEEQYHDGSALPKANDNCLEAKEMVVHPATAVIISNKKFLSKVNREQIEAEINEVIGHIDSL